MSINFCLLSLVFCLCVANACVKKVRLVCCACRFDGCDVSTCQWFAVFMCEVIAGILEFLTQHAARLWGFSALVSALVWSDLWVSFMCILHHRSCVCTYINVMFASAWTCTYGYLPFFAWLVCSRLFALGSVLFACLFVGKHCFCFFMLLVVCFSCRC